MTTDSTRTVLFVLSADSGELFNAMYFVKGAVTIRPVLLMPAGMYAIHATAVPCQAFPYDSIRDVEAAMDRHTPNVVLLYSAYLYTVNRLFDAPSVRQLVQSIRQRKLPVATSDPSLGLLSVLDADTFSAQHAARQWLYTHFNALRAVVQDMYHLYLAPRALAGHTPHMTYYNSHVILHGEDRNSLGRDLALHAGTDPSTTRWLYILSAEDYAVQLSRLGQAAFHEMIVARLKEAIAHGRQPVLIAPSDCVAYCRSHLPYPFLGCAGLGYSVFMTALHEAEYVFYWNIFSASILSRILNRGPVFFFDRGHLARAIPAIGRVGSEHFYPNCRLALLDQQRPLEAVQLAQMAQRQEAELFQPVFVNLSRSASPEEVIRQLVGSNS